MNQIPSQIQRVNGCLASRPVLSAVLTVLLLLVVVSSVPGSSFDFGTAPAWLTAVVIALSAYGFGMVVAFPRLVHQPAASVLVVLWAFAISPTLIAWSSLFLGTPRWMPSVGILASIAGFIAAIRLAKQT